LIWVSPLIKSKSKSYVSSNLRCTLLRLWFAFLGRFVRVASTPSWLWSYWFSGSMLLITWKYHTAFNTRTCKVNHAAVMLTPWCALVPNLGGTSKRCPPRIKPVWGLMRITRLTYLQAQVGKRTTTSESHQHGTRLCTTAMPVAGVTPPTPQPEKTSHYWCIEIRTATP
jgi:hypothetical protein